MLTRWGRLRVTGENDKIRCILKRTKPTLHTSMSMIFVAEVLVAMTFKSFVDVEASLVAVAKSNCRSKPISPPASSIAA